MNDMKPVAANGELDLHPAETVPREQNSADGPASHDDNVLLLAALHFAADKHRDQRRKGECASPYINHPIEVAELLVRVGGVTDIALLQAAILHDTLEDTETTAQELEKRFGSTVRRMVEEVSDDRSLPKEQRKHLQVEHAPSLSREARQIKLADKICNLRDLTHRPPPDWSAERRIAYLDWSEQVVAGCRGVNAELEREFDQACTEALARLRGRDTGVASQPPDTDLISPLPLPELPS
jgi:guanosine-3',5'-bis(diphosphate) 3'-pyrophosphohydrolase